MKEQKRIYVGSKAQDERDLIALAEAYIMPERCPGGRWVHPQYMCLHCKADASIGECRGVKPHISAKEEDA